MSPVDNWLAACRDAKFCVSTVIATFLPILHKNTFRIIPVAVPTFGVGLDVPLDAIV